MTTSPQSHHSSDYGSDIDLPDNLDPTTTNDLSSDYGSDIDLSDSGLLSLINNPPLPPPPPPQLYPTENDFTGLAKIRVKTSTRFGRDGTLVVQYDELIPTDHPATTATTDTGEAAKTLFTISDAQPEVDRPDTIPPTTTLASCSPYERFRKRRGQLSVTDLISNIWCEQQFMYTLERGFKRSTPAMEQGTKLHKVLEEQVHKVVPVEITTREDGWGLRLFNMCQGLVSLEERGMTRELEVFGWLGGVFINGIIDEITYNHPNPETLQQMQGNSQASATTTTTSDTGDDSFTTCPSSPVNVTSSPTIPFTNPTRIAYITDTKTRTVHAIPKVTQQLSTSLQLFFYHTLLTSLPTIPFHSLLKHHKLSSTARFSDGFIAQVASMGSPIPLSTLLENNSLPGLWNLVLAQYHKSIGGVGDVVGVTYRYQHSGEVIAERSWKVEEDVREKHLADVMSWWKGERGTKGVEVEEAWKCRMCDFEDNCSWRLGKLEEIREIMRASMGTRGKANTTDTGMQGVQGVQRVEEVEVEVEEGVKEVVEEGVEEVVREEKKIVKRGRPRKGSGEVGESVGGGVENEGAYSGDGGMGAKTRARGKSKRIESVGEAGESGEKGKGRGRAKKGKPNSEVDLF